MRAITLVTLATLGSCVTFEGLSAQSALGAKGRCKQLVVTGQNITKLCDGKILSTAYPDGRVGFYFVLKNGNIFTFSGYDRPNPTPDTDVVAIDKIIFGGPQAHSFPAFGRCNYGNFAKGHKTINCRATAQDGSEYKAVFEMSESPN